MESTAKKRLELCDVVIKAIIVISNITSLKKKNCILLWRLLDINTGHTSNDCFEKEISVVIWRSLLYCLVCNLGTQHFTVFYFTFFCKWGFKDKKITALENYGLNLSLLSLSKKCFTYPVNNKHLFIIALSLFTRHF